MNITVIEFSMVRCNLDNEAPICDTTGINIRFVEDGRCRSYEHNIIIHSDEYENSDVIGMKLRCLTKDNIEQLRKAIKTEIYERLNNSFKEDVDYDSFDIIYAMDDIKALRTVYNELNYLHYLPHVSWLEEKGAD